MSKQHRIDHLNDILALDDEEFERFLPDLVTWHKLMRAMVALGAESEGMVWVDDGKPGEVHSVTLRHEGSDEKQVIKGPAWAEGD